MEVLVAFPRTPRKTACDHLDFRTCPRSTRAILLSVTRRTQSCATRPVAAGTPAFQGGPCCGKPGTRNQKTEKDCIDKATGCTQISPQDPRTLYVPYYILLVERIADSEPDEIVQLSLQKHVPCRQNAHDKAHSQSGMCTPQSHTMHHKCDWLSTTP